MSGRSSGKQRKSAPVPTRREDFAIPPHPWPENLWRSMLGPGAPTPGVDGKGRVWDALASIPDREAGIVYMRYKYRCPYDYIAKAYGMSPKVVAVHERRGLRLLRGPGCREILTRPGVGVKGEQSAGDGRLQYGGRRFYEVGKQAA